MTCICNIDMVSEIFHDGSNIDRYKCINEIDWFVIETDNFYIVDDFDFEEYLLNLSYIHLKKFYHRLYHKVELHVSCCIHGEEKTLYFNTLDVLTKLNHIKSIDWNNINLVSPDNGDSEDRITKMDYHYRDYSFLFKTNPTINIFSPINMSVFKNIPKHIVLNANYDALNINITVYEYDNYSIEFPEVFYRYSVININIIPQDEWELTCNDGVVDIKYRNSYKGIININSGDEEHYVKIDEYKNKKFTFERIYLKYK